MGNKDKKASPEFTPLGSYGVFLTKNVVKKDENVTCGGVFEEEKKTIFGVFLMNFQEMLKFHRYVRPITCQQSILRGDFFQYLQMQF